MCADPKSAKKTDTLIVFFALLGSMRKLLVKSTPVLSFYFWASIFLKNIRFQVIKSFSSYSRGFLWNQFSISLLSSSFSDSTFFLFLGSRGGGKAKKSIRCQFHKRSTSSFCVRRSQKHQKDWQRDCLFCTFGICKRKSCS